MPKTFVVILADSHANHRLGLLNPDTKIVNPDIDVGEEGEADYRPALTAPQIFLWNSYQEDIDKVKSLVGKNSVVLLHNGDVSDGIPSGKIIETISPRLSDQIRMCVANLSPWFSIKTLKAVRICLGTGVHEFGLGSSSILVSDFLTEKFKRVSTKVSYHTVLSIEDILLDVSHHGPPPGSRAWLRGNMLRLYVQSLLLDAKDNSSPLPNVVVRSHYHTYIQETVTTKVDGRAFKTLAILTPSYCLLSDYSRKATKSEPRVSVGTIVLEVEGGRIIDVHEYLHAIDLRLKETL